MKTARLASVLCILAGVSFGAINAEARMEPGYKAKVQNLIFKALKGNTRYNAQLRSLLKTAKPSAIRFSTKLASFRTNGKAQALRGVAEVRELKYSLPAGKARIFGDSELTVFDSSRGKIVIDTKLDGPLDIFRYHIGK